jgi:hypothetical protein
VFMEGTVSVTSCFLLKKHLNLKRSEYLGLISIRKSIGVLRQAFIDNRKISPSSIA